VTEVSDQFWRDGFVIVRDLFAPSEIAVYRKAARNRADSIADLLCDPTLREALLARRLLELIRELIGPDICYFGDSSAMRGDAIPGFHKDNADKDDAAGPDWQGRYPLVRFGIYTQNHDRRPDGLDVRRGSHDHCSTRIGKHVYIDTRPGDVVIWNLRTTHSGAGMTVAGRPVDPESLAGKILRRLPALRDKPREERVALFGTFGAPGPHLGRYIAYLRTRQYAVAGWLASRYDEAALGFARDRGVAVRDMRREIEREPPASLHAGHVPLPY
jgi:hypothetical protein